MRKLLVYLIVGFCVFFVWNKVRGPVALLEGKWRSNIMSRGIPVNALLDLQPGGKLEVEFRAAFQGRPITLKGTGNWSSYLGYLRLDIKDWNYPIKIQQGIGGRIDSIGSEKFVCIEEGAKTTWYRIPAPR